jgi:repressor LexA
MVIMTKTNQQDLKGYAFIRNSIVHTGITPSLREVGKAIGYDSPRSVQLMLERLEKRGLVGYSEGIIKLCSRKNLAMTEQTVDVPLVGSVACGLPSLAKQDPEAVIEVSTKIARPGHTYFVLRARGTSMNKSGIKDGDLLLVRQQPTAEENEKVVALINDEATVKHFHSEGDMIVLKPNSTDPTNKPIVLSDEFMIQGVVTATLPKNLY